MDQKLEPEIENFASFLEKQNKESDRGLVLISGAMLDERLKDILSNFLLEGKSSQDLLDGFNAPLGTFSARIAACYSLGLIEKNEFDELTLVRKIRNEFAHTWDETNFESKKLKELCAKLPWCGPREMEKASTMKMRFSMATTALVADLLWRTRLVRKERRESKSWPNKSRKNKLKAKMEENSKSA